MTSKRRRTESGQKDRRTERQKDRRTEKQKESFEVKDKNEPEKCLLRDCLSAEKYYTCRLRKRMLAKKSH